MSAPRSQLSALLAALKSSRVVRVAVAYGSASFVVLQLADLLLPKLGVPAGSDVLLLLLLVVGFAFAMLLAYALGPDADPAAATIATREVKPQPSPAGADDEPRKLCSLAVLPFADLSPNRDQEFFSDGASEELLSALARVKGLRVPARTSSFAFKGKNADVREIGEKLGVEAVLEGSVRTDGKRLRITAELVEVATGYNLWSETFDSELSDIFAVQNEITRKIVNALRGHLPCDFGEPVVGATTADPEAYKLYLKGRHCWNKASEDALRRALQHFQQALDLDPLYARAWSGLADALVALGNQTYLDPNDAYPRAKSAAQRAVQIDPDLSDAHAALGLVALSYEWNLESAEEAFRRAVTLDQGSSTARQHYSRQLSASGRHEEAIEQARRALALDPLSLAAHVRLCAVYRNARRYDDSADVIRRTHAFDSDKFPIHFQLAWTYAYAGHCMEAAAAAERAAEIDRRSTLALGALGYAYAVCGRAGEARALLAQMEAAAEREYVCPYQIALVYAGLGEPEQALDWLDRGYAQRDHAMIFLNIDAGFDLLREQPRFVTLLEKLGLAAKRA